MDSSRLDQLAGIDFGTSNSSVGVFKASKPALLDVSGQGNSVPSAIFYSTEDAETSFGKQALSCYAEGLDGRLLRSLKSVLGTGLMKEKTQIRNRRVAFSDIIGDFFGFLKYQLESQDGPDIDSVVLGRPVRFVDDDEARDREAQSQLRDIAAAAGFSNIEFQFEPIAAALSYESTVTREELVVVVDIGGGTADFSVLRLSPEQCAQHDRASDVLGNMGVHLGGTDFDRLLSLYSVMPDLGFGTGVRGTNRVLPGSVYFDLATWHRIPLLYSPTVLNNVRRMRLDAVEKERLELLEHIVENRLGHALARSVETAKIDLSSTQTTRIRLESENSLLVDHAVTRGDMEQAIHEAVSKLRACVVHGLKQAEVKPSDIVSVFYTGGSSSIPCIRDAFEELMPCATHVHGDAFGSVGMGLTMDAARKFA